MCLRSPHLTFLYFIPLSLCWNTTSFSLHIIIISYFLYYINNYHILYIIYLIKHFRLSPYHSVLAGGRFFRPEVHSRDSFFIDMVI